MRTIFEDGILIKKIKCNGLVSDMVTDSYSFDYLKMIKVFDDTLKGDIVSVSLYVKINYYK